MKILGDQTFWLGSLMTATIALLAMMIGLSTNKISFSGQSDAGNARVAVENEGAGGYPVQPSGYPSEPEAPREIVIEKVTKDDWVRGDRKAEISVVEYSDIDCPFCTRFHATMKQVLEQYEGKVNWVYRDFPLDALHPQARDKAIAAECVGKLSDNDTYWEYLDALFAGSAPDEVIVEATKLGIDPEAFATCRADKDIEDGVAEEVAEAGRAGGTGTPYSVIVVGDQKIPVNGAVPLQQITAQLDNVLAN